MVKNDFKYLDDENEKKSWRCCLSKKKIINNSITNHDNHTSCHEMEDLSCFT